MGVYLWKERLPSAYQEVEYIQSSGGQYTDTGYVPSSSPDIDITFEFVGGNSGQWVPIYGRRYPGVSPNAKIALFINSDSCYISPNYGTFDPGIGGGVTISKNTKYDMVNDVGQFYIDGVLKTGLSTTTTLSEYGTGTLYLFDTNDNYGTVLNRGTQIKLYSCKLYNSGTLIRDLIPCYRKSDGVIGLYDAVDGGFYTNLGTGTFTKGPDINYIEHYIEHELKNAYIGERNPFDDYQEVEYIQSSGTQYIDCGLSLGSNNFEIDVDFTVNSFYSQEQAICSIWTSTYKYWNLFIRTSNYKTLDCYTASHHETSALTAGIKYNAKLTRTSNSWVLSKDGVNTTWTYAPGSVNDTTLKLFTRGDIPGTSSSNTHINMYSCKVSVGGNLIRDFVPCYRKSDTVIGLYDIVNNVFYTNSGTGTFTKGPDVN